MKGPLTHFPVTKTTVPGLKKKFDLNDPKDRKNYFEAKAGTEIAKLRKYFESNPKLVGEILEEGRKYCSEIAQRTLGQVKQAMGLLP